MSQTQYDVPKPEETNSPEFWDNLYGSNISPWDTGKVDRFLRQALSDEKLPQHASVLDIGCGTGTNAIWLAEQGFKVTGVDLSTVAIERAKLKAVAANVRCDFVLADILSARLDNAPFDFAFDLGCFHEFDLMSNRAAFSRSIASLLKPGAMLLSISGSRDGAAFEYGPPRRSAREIIETLEPQFRLISMRSDYFDREWQERSEAWICLLKRRDQI